MADKLVYAYRQGNGLQVQRGVEGETIVKHKTYIVDSSTGKERFAYPHSKTVKIAFSPSDNFMVTYEPYVIYGMRTMEDGTKRTPDPNLRFFDVRTGEHLQTLICAKPNNWRPQFSDDEKLCVVLNSGSELHFYENSKFDHFRKGVIKGISNFELSPGLDPSLACFTPSAGGKPGLLQLRSPYGDLRVGCQKSCFNGETCSMQWNSKGYAVLMTTNVEVDRTNQSYYGISYVYLLTKGGESFQVPLSKEGPLHSMQWSPNGNNFVACFGFMPAKIAVFNLKAHVIWDFGETHRNEVYYNPFGNLLVTCGFGNLSAGHIDVWDTDKRTEVVHLAAPSTTFFSWAPDGQHFVTATTSPRLRVDNNFRIWHYTGELRKEYLSQEDGKQIELLQFSFKPTPNEYSRFKIQELSESDKKRIANLKIKSSIPDSPVLKLQQAGIVTASSAYVPPHLRKANGGSNAQSTAKSAQAQGVKAPRPEISQHEKDIRNCEKKIKDIQQLVKKRDEGAKLEANQLTKIEKLADLEDELAKLKLQEA